MTLLALVLVIAAISHSLVWSVGRAVGRIEGAERMAHQIERDASLKSAARRLDAEWDQTHGQKP